MSVCMYVRMMHVGMYACLPIMHTHVRTYIHTYIRPSTHTYIHREGEREGQRERERERERERRERTGERERERQKAGETEKQRMQMSARELKHKNLTIAPGQLGNPENTVARSWPSEVLEPTISTKSFRVCRTSYIASLRMLCIGCGPLRQVIVPTLLFRRTGPRSCLV